MKLLQFKQNDKVRLGIKADEVIIDVAAASEAWELNAPVSLEEVIRGGAESFAALEQVIAAAADKPCRPYVLDDLDIIYAPAVTSPQKIICVGLNYRKHAEETKSDIPTSPILFNKFANALSAHGDAIQLPHTSNEVDYEAELAIVIGKTAKNVDEADALDYVFGYCCANDLSARNLQRRTSQWMLGKTCDGFAPLGPYIVTSDEVGDPDKLYISCSVNGEQKQSSNTEDMIFSCKSIISYISQHMTLMPGDIILTGTPEGVVVGKPKDQRVYLRDGDVVAVQIEKLGELVVTMVSSH